MISRPTLILLAAVFAATGCRNGNEQESTAIQPTAPSAVEVPGIILSPTEDTLALSPGTAVLLYYWLPLDGYPDMKEDLAFLASLDSTVIPVPVQPDRNARNHAQLVVNGMDVSLTVYLADSEAMRLVDTGILPHAVLLRPGGKPVHESGFGAPKRLLDTDSPEE